jgi:hypothetical protein
MEQRIHFVVIFLLISTTVSAQPQSMYPVISQATQRLRDEDRRTILQGELMAERESLSKMQAAFSSVPTQEQSADLHRHVQNVKALERELEGIEKAAATGIPRIVIKATRATAKSVAGSARSTGSFWDPYNRASEITTFQTTEKKDAQ